MLDDKMMLSVVVAAYNEADIIESNIKRIVSVLRERPDVTWELLIVNDGSSDDTGRILDEVAEKTSGVFVDHLWRNFGQGRALRRGFSLSQGAIIVTLDVDLSYGPEYIWKLYDANNDSEAEIILASPYCKGGSVRNVPAYRRWLSRWANRYLAKMSHHNISTSTCVVRSYRRDVLDELYLTSDGMELQFEVLMKAGSLGCRVLEIPADLAWHDDKKSGASFVRSSKMNIMRSIRLYLYLGWLSKPAYAFTFSSGLLLVPGCYMAFWLLVLTVQAVGSQIQAGDGVRWAISNGLANVFNAHTYSFAISAALIIVGIQMLVFALLTLQTKYYFDEIHKLGQKILKDGSRKS